MTPIEGPSDQYLLSGKNSGQGQAREASTRHSMTGHSHDRHRPCHDRHRPCHDRTQAMTGHRPCHDRTQAMTEQGRAGPGPVQGRQDQDQEQYQAQYQAQYQTQYQTQYHTQYPVPHCPGTRYPVPPLPRYHYPVPSTSTGTRTPHTLRS